MVGLHCTTLYYSILHYTALHYYILHHSPCTLLYTALYYSGGTTLRGSGIPTDHSQLQPTLHSTVCTVYCTLYSVQWIEYSVQWTVYNVQGSVYTIQWTVHTWQGTVYTAQGTVVSKVECVQYSRVQYTTLLYSRRVHLSLFCSVSQDCLKFKFVKKYRLED